LVPFTGQRLSVGLKNRQKGFIDLLWIEPVVT
jgi:hypothetical protein